MKGIVRRHLANRISHVRGILFDMDGVLISSTDSDEKSWLRWARIHGMEGTFSVHATHGRRTIDTLRMLRPDLDPFVELMRLEDFDAESQGGIVALPGVKSLIASLPANMWTIVTSASEKLMRSRLEFAGIPSPQNVVSADNVTRGKPYPEPYETGARILDLKPPECLVIEDTPAGIEAGKAAGCNVLAVLSSHSASDLGKADWVVPSLDHLTAIQAGDGTVAIHLVV